jgi:citrate lyase subunit alpha/citrate CoA-transferase
VNPRRPDLLEALERSGTDLPIRSIEEIKQEVEHVVGGPPEKPRLLDVPVAVIKWVDGTVLDTVWQVADEAD